MDGGHILEITMTTLVPLLKRSWTKSWINLDQSFETYQVYYLVPGTTNAPLLGADVPNKLDILAKMNRQGNWIVYFCEYLESM